MDWMISFWNSVTEPQAQIISSTMTILAAILGVLLGSWLFGRRVKDLTSAVEASDKVLQDHKNKVEADFEAIRGTVEGLDAQVGAAVETLGQLRGAVGDIQSVAPAALPVQGPEEEDTPRGQLRVAWDAVRDQMEKLAANPEIDGRTRAKYARIDRRRYGDLQEALARDGRLAGNATLFREAVELWQRFRSGRSEPSADDVTRMRVLQRQLSG